MIIKVDVTMITLTLKFRSNELISNPQQTDIINHITETNNQTTNYIDDNYWNNNKTTTVILHHPLMKTIYGSPRLVIMAFLG